MLPHASHVFNVMCAGAQVRPLVAKPKIETADKALLRRFPFRASAPEAPVEAASAEQGADWTSTSCSAQQLKVAAAVRALGSLFREPFTVCN